jgi:hypothetical protein
MFPWNKLPHDLRYLILQTFCSGIAREYLDAYLGNQRSVTEKLACFELVSDLAEPTHPAASFTSFLSAIQVNHEFNHLILESVRVEGGPFRLYLLILQRQTIATLAEIKTTPSHRCPTFGGSVDYIRTGLGNFWKNPLVIEDENLIPSVLYWSCQTTSDYLPHLGPWLSWHARWDHRHELNRRVNAVFFHPECRKMLSKHFREHMATGLPPPPLDHSDWAQMRADIEVLGLEWLVFDPSPIVGFYSVKILDQLAGTVNDLADHSDPELQSGRHFLLEEDLRRFYLNSCQQQSMDSWWFFPEMSIPREGEMPLVDCGTFINFREKRMYTYSSPEISIVWDNPYDKKTWKTLSTIEEIEEYRNNEVDWWDYI